MKSEIEILLNRSDCVSAHNSYLDFQMNGKDREKLPDFVKIIISKEMIKRIEKIANFLKKHKISEAKLTAELDSQLFKDEKGSLIKYDGPYKKIVDSLKITSGGSLIFSMFCWHNTYIDSQLDSYKKLKELFFK